MFKIQNFIIFTFTMLNTLKLYHWNTKIYSRHKSSDELINNFLQNLTDNFVESYLGNNLNDTNLINEFDIIINNFKDENIIIEIKKYIKYITKIQSELQTHTDLLNILDEILNNLNTALYLFNLK